MLAEQDPSAATPKSSDSFVIYPYRSFRQRFDQTAYSKALVGQGMSHEDINKVLTGIEIILGKKVAILGIFTYFLILLFMLSIVNLFVLSDFTGISSWSSGSMYQYFLGLFALIIVLSILQKRQINEARVLVEEYLEKNAQEFVKEGLKWHLPAQFPQWIELRRETPELGSPTHKMTTLKNHVSLLVPLTQ